MITCCRCRLYRRRRCVLTGLANAEFDALVVTWEPLSEHASSEEGGDSAGGQAKNKNHVEEVRLVTRVLGIVESKSDPNDVGASFFRLQETLSFLTDTDAESGGGGGYDPVRKSSFLLLCFL